MIKKAAKKKAMDDPSSFDRSPLILPMIGKKAPAFTAADQNGEKISLKDFEGKRVIVYFYPHADTPTCTQQACNLRDNYSNLLQEGFEIIGISTDPVKKHKKFETKYELPFALLADEDHAISDKYNVWGEKKFMGRVFDGIHRTTFLIDEKGKIKALITKPHTKVHADEIMEAWHS